VGVGDRKGLQGNSANCLPGAIRHEKEGRHQMDILYLVDRLENLIASSRKMPLLNQIIIKEGELFGIVDQMRT